MSITFAQFENHNVAKQASQRLRKRLGKGGRVEVIQNDRRLSHHVVPMRMTAARVGAVAGGIIVGGLSLRFVLVYAGQHIGY